MKTTRFKAFLLYTSSIAFVFAWWSFAFQQPPSVIPNPSAVQTPVKYTRLLPEISRDDLYQALCGDFQLMVRLMTEWDYEIDWLEQQGYSHLNRLSKEKLKSAFLLKNQLAIQEKSSKRFFPQSYAAAGILLSISPTERIVAIPSGLRKQTQLFPKSLTDRIPLSVDYFSSEQLYRLHPDLAFIAPYSNPLVVETLKTQQIPTVEVSYPSTILDIPQSIIEVGAYSENPIEAHLLALFYQAAIYAIDNRAQLLQSCSSRKILYLTYHSGFSIPTHMSLSGQLVKRLHLNDGLLMGASSGWRVPIDRENIHRFNPDCIIISSAQNSLQIASWDPLIRETKAAGSHKIYNVDESIQETPTHFLALAYYDLFSAVERACLE